MPYFLFNPGYEPVSLDATTSIGPSSSRYVSSLTTKMRQAQIQGKLSISFVSEIPKPKVAEVPVVVPFTEPVIENPEVKVEEEPPIKKKRRPKTEKEEEN